MKRNSKIELLRILCMLGITAHHLVYHSDIMSQPLGASRLFAQFFMMFGKGGVNVFVLISGYYLAGNGEIDYRRSAGRALKAWRRVLLYSLLLAGAALAFFRGGVNRSGLVQSVFPILTKHYWFMTAYIGLLILEPFLNRLLHSLDEDGCRKLLLALGLMLMLPPWNPWYGHLPWFAFLYCTAGCLRLHGPRWLTTQPRRALAAVGCFAFMWLFSVAMSLLEPRYARAGEYVNALAMRMQNPFMYFGSVAAFLFFTGLRPASVPWIDRAAGHVLACYLIQSNIFMYRVIWDFVDARIPKQGLAYPLAVAGVVLALVAGCMAVDAVVDAAVGVLRRLLRRPSRQRPTR